MTAQGTWRHKFPLCDVFESNLKYFFVLELAGVSPEEFDVSVRPGFLFVKGTKRQHNLDEDVNSYKIERDWGKFNRLYHLPGDTKEETANCCFKNGLLTVTFEKSAVQNKLVVHTSTAVVKK